MNLVEITKEDYDIGYSVDDIYQIESEKEIVGHICLSKLEIGYFLEWIEIEKTHRGTGLLRTVLTAVFEELNVEELYLESSDGLLDLYLHIGAEKLSYDKFREMSELLLKRDTMK